MIGPLLSALPWYPTGYVGHVQQHLRGLLFDKAGNLIAIGGRAQRILLRRDDLIGHHVRLLLSASVEKLAFVFMVDTLLLIFRLGLHLLQSAMSWTLAAQAQESELVFIWVAVARLAALGILALLCVLIVGGGHAI